MSFSKTYLKYSIFVISIGLVLSSALSAHFHQSSIQIYSAPLTANVATSEAVSLPVRLKIPSINIDAVVEQVGLTQGGAMDVPQKPNDAAWFSPGPRPGEIGSAVIDGHSGYKDNKPAVFDSLNKLKKGDKIYVEDGAGATATFVVRDLRNYDPKADAESVFNSNDGASHLNLITCSGSWNDVEQTHSTRLVVFADKE